MVTTRTQHSTALTRFTLSGAAALLALVGPVLTVLAAPLVGWEPAMVHNLQLVALVAWSPVLPFGVPALLTQDLRDLHRCLPGRSAPLLPVYLFCTGPSGLVRFSWANVAGVALAAAVVV